MRGVRTQSAGRVQLRSLRDGWAVFPDWDATHRRWVSVGLAGAILLFVIAPILLKLVGTAGTGVGVLAVTILVASWIGDTRAQRRARHQKQQLRFDAIHRAGGLDSLQWVAATGGRVEHLAERRRPGHTGHLHHHRQLRHRAPNPSPRRRSHRFGQRRHHHLPGTRPTRTRQNS
jgi:hypothetical protein